MKPEDIFEGFVISGKGGLILMLVILAFINGHTSYVAQKPRRFLLETIYTAGFGALAAVWLAITRGRKDLMLGHALFAFMLFFLYNVCREFAGYFAIASDKDLTSTEAKEKKLLGLPIKIAVALGIVIGTGLALYARVKPDYCKGFMRGWPMSGALALETIVFASIVTAGEVLVAQSKKEPLLETAGLSMGMFIAAHLVLNFGGFYNHLYHTHDITI